MLGHLKRRAIVLTGAGAPPSEATVPATNAPATAWRRPSRYWLMPGALLVPFLALLLAAVVTLNWGGVYPGVRVGDVDLSGAARQEAAAAIGTEAARWEAATVTLSAPQGAYSFTREELGLHYDRDAVLAAVLAQGRDAPTPERLAAILRMAWYGREVLPAFWVDDAALRARVQSLAGATDVQSRDGDLRIEGGRVVIVPAVEGRGLDIDGAAAQTIAAIGPDGPGALRLPVAEHIQPRVNDAVLAGARARAEALLATPVRLTGADLDVEYDAATIGSWLVVRRDPEAQAEQRLTIAVNPRQVRATVAPLAGEVYLAPRNAAYAFNPAANAFAITTPARNERALEVEPTVAAILEALEGGAGPRVVAVSTRSRPPALTDADITTANAQATTTYLAGPLAFTYSGKSWTIPAQQLAKWLTIEPGGRLVFDEDALSDYIIGLKQEINRPAVDATYTMDEGSDVYRVTGPSQIGLSVDGPAAFRAAMVALTSGGGRAIALPVTQIPPKVTEATVAAMEGERWVRVDLTAQRMYAMVGKKPIYTAVISSGKKDWETPTGTFYILRRVENETMTSNAIGAEDFYHLENVLYTQYFTGEGHALHYSWWKEPGSFGTPTSHGCVSQTLKDSEYFWNFARVGTRVTIEGKTPLR